MGKTQGGKDPGGATPPQVDPAVALARRPPPPKTRAAKVPDVRAPVIKRPKSGGPTGNN